MLSLEEEEEEKEEEDVFGILSTWRLYRDTRQVSHDRRCLPLLVHASLCRHTLITARGF
jgi:hypothetical protein